MGNDPHWFANDGKGLNAKHANMLAKALKEKIANGEVETYIQSREEWLTTANTTIMFPEQQVFAAMQKAAGEPLNISGYDIDLNYVKEWVAFLEASGSFRIC